jgi:hypothetical protein
VWVSSSGSPYSVTDSSAIAVCQSQSPVEIGYRASTSASTYTYRSSASLGSSKQKDARAPRSRTSQTRFPRSPRRWKAITTWRSGTASESRRRASQSMTTSGSCRAIAGSSGIRRSAQLLRDNSVGTSCSPAGLSRYGPVPRDRTVGSRPIRPSSSGFRRRRTRTEREIPGRPSASALNPRLPWTARLRTTSRLQRSPTCWTALS